MPHSAQYYVLRAASIVLVSSIGLLALFTGANQTLSWGLEPNHCDMTYMWPSWIEVYEAHTAGRRRGICDKYTLYYYVEGDVTAGTEEQRLKQLSGVPVLFIPGNAGSHKQGRSLGSEAHNIYKQLSKSGKVRGEYESRHVDDVKWCDDRRRSIYVQNISHSLYS